jgi:hypothetical protein
VKKKTKRKRTPSRADVAAVMGELGRLGGKARAAALSPERRREIARAAVNARWERQRKEHRS